MIHVGNRFSVPSNSSRFFDDRATSLSQPLGTIQLAWDEFDPFLINSAYSEQLIKYDEQYCTSVSAIGINYTIPTLDYFEDVLRHLPSKPTILEIGCGQGELVLELESRGMNVSGFDPVLRIETPNLIARNWRFEDPAADLYIMRCVLPHIKKPWDFLAGISESSPNSLVLIEFQRLEWIIEKNIWYQVSHDHVNLFSLKDFTTRFHVTASGIFSNGEWGWVLLDPSEIEKSLPKTLSVTSLAITTLFENKLSFLHAIEKLDRPLVIWGGAGKGIVLAHSLRAVSERITAVDADFRRWNLYMEASGVEILSPERGIIESDRKALILVCNPNHRQQVEGLVARKLQVCLPEDLI